MTLFRQISVLVVVGFFTLMVLIGLNNLKQTTSLLRGQMNTTAQDTATVLAISISRTHAAENVAVLETLFNAVFDSGYYSSIRMLDNDGNVSQEKTRSLSVLNVPDRFVELVALDAAVGRAQIVKGWAPIGAIEITLHPGYAYAVLYQRMIATILWFGFVLVVVLGALWCGLHRVLRPLKSIVRQAEAIQNNNFSVQTALPRTKDLRDVVNAMNRLTRSVKSNFDDQQAIWSRYQSLLYSDELTGLRNRRFIMAELHRFLAEKSTQQGAMALIKVNGYSEFSQRKGYDAADSLLKRIAKLLAGTAGDGVMCTSARLSDNEFAVLVDRDRDLLESLVTAVFCQFEEQISGTTSGVVLNAGLVSLSGGASISGLLAQLDLTVNQASSAGPYAVHHVAHQKFHLPEGRTQWRDWLTSALASDEFYLVAQPVFDASNSVVQREVFVRVDDHKGHSVPAGVFMPMAVSLGLDAEIYRCILRKLPTALAFYTETLALNFPGLYLENDLMYGEFTALLAKLPRDRQKLAVEVEHNHLIAHPEAVARLVEHVRSQGQAFGIDHCDLSAPVSLLQTSNPDYIKIGAKVLDDYAMHPDRPGYSAFRGITHALDVRIVAVGIDEPALYSSLKSIGIDGFQGNLLAEPEVVE